MEGLYMQCIWKYIQQCLTLGYQVCGYFLVDLYFSHSYKENTLLSDQKTKIFFTVTARLLLPHLPPFFKTHFSTLRSRPALLAPQSLEASDK